MDQSLAAAIQDPRQRLPRRLRRRRGPQLGVSRSSSGVQQVEMNLAADARRRRPSLAGGVGRARPRLSTRTPSRTSSTRLPGPPRISEVHDPVRLLDDPSRSGSTTCPTAPATAPVSGRRRRSATSETGRLLFHLARALARSVLNWGRTSASPPPTGGRSVRWRRTGDPIEQSLARLRQAQSLRARNRQCRDRGPTSPSVGARWHRCRQRSRQEPRLRSNPTTSTGSAADAGGSSCSTTSDGRRQGRAWDEYAPIPAETVVDPGAPG